jgi:hypothetical protein
MNSDDTQAAIVAIGLIAATQANLVEKANASPKHTQLVLEEIAERCAAIGPSKRVYDFGEIAKEEQLQKFLSGVVGFVEATSEEQHGVWRTYVHDTTSPLSWQQEHGLGFTIGYLDDRPVHVSLFLVKVAGHPIIFYNTTSTVVDHDMVRAFIDAIAPDTAKKEGGRTNETNATNFCNVLPREPQT